MIKHVRPLARAATLGLAALALAPLASAAIVTGNWDPKLPSSFGNYGWTATVNVSVDPACAVGTQALTIVNLLGFSFGCNTATPTTAFRILSAEVGIYNYSTNVIVDVLRFNRNSFGEFIVGELQLGPNGSIMSLVTPADSDIQGSSIVFADGFRYDFRLDLPGADPKLKYRRDNASFLTPFTTATEPVTERRFVVDTTSTAAQVVAATRLEIGQTIFAVPEPGSLALALLALGAAGVAARRRIGLPRALPAA
ncbi:PEP-CTERM sorting domain-containing protein [Rubrivivax rivuli]|uniref:PEP-CTERM sorting domain-containing protein n=1 Tax=Rubrivivax rivuli TaxID=1862385 RepID=A0A437RCR4_9BURK|nr:PEP-CTERM sorting domain-containing protein [Rubrivivax rivuli]RVU44507.1 PEP-CTERM sorting domain-containing protein [Rubrivivax rivuli]